MEMANCNFTTIEREKKSVGGQEYPRRQRSKCMAAALTVL